LLAAATVKAIYLPTCQPNIVCNIPVGGQCNIAGKVSQCESGSTCNSTTNVCTKMPVLGESCSSSCSNSKGNTYCNTTTMKCEAPAPLGHYCGVSNQCDSEKCSNHTCVANVYASLGESCATLPCNFDLSCESDVCIAFGSRTEGQSCTVYTQCQPGLACSLSTSKCVTVTFASGIGCNNTGDCNKERWCECDAYGGHARCNRPRVITDACKSQFNDYSNCMKNYQPNHCVAQVLCLDECVVDLSIQDFERQTPPGQSYLDNCNPYSNLCLASDGWSVHASWLLALGMAALIPLI